MAIRWWYTDRLVEDLAADHVSQRDAATYALLGVVLNYFTVYGSAWNGGNRSWLLVFEFVVVTVIALFGVLECFKANGGMGGRDFLVRYFCIGVPVGIKLALLS